MAAPSPSPHRADTAFPHRDARFSVQVLSYAPIPVAKSRVKRARAQIAPYGSGAYANYADPDLTNAAARLLRRQPAAVAPGQGGVRPGEPLPPLSGRQVMVMGVPTSTSLSSLRMSAFFMRTQPCEILPGIRPGRQVPWMPTMPPPGQSVSVSDVALVT